MNQLRRATTLVMTSRPAVVAVFMFLLSCAPLSASDPAGPSQIWLVSTRSLPGYCAGDPAAQLAYWVLTEDSQWQRTPPEEFSAADSPAVPTVVFLHGNRVGREEAVNRGWLVYQLIKCGSPDKPFRFVIWSWPADQIRGELKDVRVKAARSDAEAHYLAGMVSRIHPDVPLTLIGYSFGARSITGALQLLADGSLSEDAGAARRIRAMLIAAAVDSHWLSPGCRHGNALGLLEQAFITVNPCDRALRFYPLLYRCSDPQALGWKGPSYGCRGSQAAKMDLADVSRAVGEQHDFFRYVHASSVTSRLAWYCFLDEPLPAEPAADPQSVGPALSSGPRPSEESMAAAD